LSLFPKGSELKGDLRVIITKPIGHHDKATLSDYELQHDDYEWQHDDYELQDDDYEFQDDDCELQDDEEEPVDLQTVIKSSIQSVRLNRFHFIMKLAAMSHSMTLFFSL
jgi:hypothetical protein